MPSAHSRPTLNSCSRCQRTLSSLRANVPRPCTLDVCFKAEMPFKCSIAASCMPAILLVTLMPVICVLHAAIEFASAVEDLREQAAAAAAQAQELADSFAEATPLQVHKVRAKDHCKASWRSNFATTSLLVHL
jgi:hypothetical protein